MLLLHLKLLHPLKPALHLLVPQALSQVLHQVPLLLLNLLGLHPALLPLDPALPPLQLLPQLPHLLFSLHPLLMSILDQVPVQEEDTKATQELLLVV